MLYEAQEQTPSPEGKWYKQWKIQSMTETIEDVMIYYILLNTGYEWFKHVELLLYITGI